MKFIEVEYFYLFFIFFQFYFFLIYHSFSHKNRAVPDVILSFKIPDTGNLTLVNNFSRFPVKNNGKVYF